MSAPLMNAEKLVKWYDTRAVGRRAAAPIRAVDGVSFTIGRGETLGLVGESGSGKSTVARLLLGLEQPTSGTVSFKGAPFLQGGRAERRRARRKVQMVFQDPYQSLDPCLSALDAVVRPMRIQRMFRGEEESRARALLDAVGIAASGVHRRPSAFSGGQRQRIAIARALALEPELVILDEPVSALDASVRAQILNLLRDLQKETEVAYLFVTHDLSVAHHICDRVAVMYLGRLLEVGDNEEIFRSATHPYSQALLSAVPDVEGGRASARDRIVLVGDIPSPRHPPSGCHFRTRCWKVQSRCLSEEPPLRASGDSPHASACHFPEVRA